MTLTIDQDYLINTLTDLIRINSINPTLVPGEAGEMEIAAYVAGSLRRIGLDVATHEPDPGRISVVGTLRGRGGGRSLMLNAHVDTAGVENMPDPFSPAIPDGRTYGPGAYDLTGSLAACLAAAQTLAGSRARLGAERPAAACALRG